MKLKARLFAGSLSACLLVLAGCVSIPRSKVPESQFGQLSCEQLTSEAAQAEQTKRVATETRAESWKAIVPVAVVGRYANASSAMRDADKRAASLGEQQKQKGCVSAAN